MAKSKYEQNRIFTLNSPNAPRLDMNLAMEIGLNESILFLQLEFWIAIGDKWRDGRKWTYASISDLIKEFPIWSKGTIERTINSLKKQDLIITGNYNKLSFDRTTWYAINFETASKLTSIAIEKREETSDAKPLNENIESTEEKAVEERIWNAFDEINRFCPKDAIQKNAVKKMAGHVVRGELPFNDIIYTAEILSGSDYDKIPVVPNKVLEHVQQWSYKDALMCGHSGDLEHLYDEEVEFEYA